MVIHTSAGNFTLFGIAQGRDATQAAIVILQDSPPFDAGKGSRWKPRCSGWPPMWKAWDRRPRMSPRLSFTAIAGAAVILVWAWWFDRHRVPDA